MVIVELDERKRSALRTIEDPVEVYKAMRDGRSLICVSEADIDRQMIDGVTVEYIFARNEQFTGARLRSSTG